MSRIRRFLESIARSSDIGPAVVHAEEIHSRPRRTSPPPGGLSPRVLAGLESLGIGRLYTHQAAAVEAVFGGRDVVVVTPTASGKTLCYNVPVLDRCAGRPGARSLYLFPIKALEQDQLGSFREFAAACGFDSDVRAEIYDGDTSSYRRGRIRSDPPQVVITNPDMLHMGILAYHEKWEAFFSNLEFVVLDEVHTYRGVFGSHVAHVLRRLLRTAARYGARPQVIACSATIANPGELVSRLVGREVEVVAESGAPEAGRHVVFVNPGEHSTSSIASRLLRKAIKADLATIVFTKARKITELIYTWAVQSDPRLRRSVSAYRAGYLPEERREIEQQLFSGSLKGVVSTSALEMGIDIGVLDVCVLVGYPGAVTTTWQRGGRVGRQDRESLIVLVAGQDALDQYFMKHPRAFFDAGFEPAVIDPANRPILKSHLTCAAAEFPLARDDPWYGAAEIEPVLEELADEGRLVRAVDDEAWHSPRRYPQREINIRGVGESYAIFEAPPAGRAEPEKPRVIGSLDGNRVYAEGHPGAVYLHRAGQYEVTRLDLERKNLWARPARVDYFTVAKREKETEILETRGSRLVKNFVTRLGALKVTEQVTGYDKKRVSTGVKISTHGLDLPPYSFETVGFWLEIDDFIPRAVAKRGLNFMGGIHAVEHAAIALFPLFALCESSDVGGISTPLHPQTGTAAIFIYDGYPGGVGLAEKSYLRLEELLRRTLSVIEECDCEAGCPGCIYSSKCGSGNVPLDKAAAVMVLSLLLDEDRFREWVALPDVPAVPPEEPLPAPAPAPAAPDEPRVLVLDIETRRGAQEVGGWANSHLMGVAVAVVRESPGGAFRAFREEEVEELLRALGGADLVVGFNVVGFDYRVLSAYDRGTLSRVPTFDILTDVRRRLGHRLSLAHLAEATLDAAKSADGLQSLEWVRQGRLDLVEEYCRRDVEITWRLFEHGLAKGWLHYFDREGRRMQLRLDWDLQKIIEAARGGT